MYIVIQIHYNDVRYDISAKKHKLVGTYLILRRRRVSWQYDIIWLYMRGIVDIIFFYTYIIRFDFSRFNVLNCWKHDEELGGSDCQILKCCRNNIRYVLVPAHRP